MSTATAITTFLTCGFCQTVFAFSSSIFFSSLSTPSFIATLNLVAQQSADAVHRSKFLVIFNHFDIRAGGCREAN